MEFCLRLAGEAIVEGIKENRDDKNFVMSPLALNCMLNMVASGAKGRTLEQLLEFLQCESIEDLDAQASRMVGLATTVGQSSRREEEQVAQKKPEIDQSIRSWGLQARARREAEYRARQKGPELTFVGGVWIARIHPINPSFQQRCKDVYKAEAKTVDFELQGEQVSKEVNAWVENETKGLIKNLIPPGCIGELTTLILANAIYFKGEWDCPFITSATRNEDFHLLSGATIKVPFMTSSWEDHFYGAFEGFKILKLPYANGQDNKKFSLYVFLPERIDGLQELIQNFNSQSMFLKKNLKLKKVRLPKMWIPKFKFSFEFDASDIMKKLGLTLPFVQIGDFTKMADSPRNHEIYVKQIFQKSCIEVNEEGTEAAAACFTRLCGGGSAASLPPCFIADHPFMFTIKEEVSDVVFFAGTVLNPLKKD